MSNFGALNRKIYTARGIPPFASHLIEKYDKADPTKEQIIRSRQLFDEYVEYSDDKEMTPERYGGAIRKYFGDGVKEPAAGILSFDVQSIMGKMNAFVFDDMKISTAELMRQQPKGKSSYEKGKIGEFTLFNTFKKLYSDVEYVAEKQKKGDFIVEEKCMIEVKNWKSTVRTTQVNKFVRDIGLNRRLLGGIMVSLNSKIAKMKTDVVIKNDIGQIQIYVSKPTIETIQILINIVLTGGLSTDKQMKALKELKVSVLDNRVII